MVVIAVSAGTAILDLLPPWIIRYTVDRIVLRDAEVTLLAIAAALMGLAVLHGAADFARLYLTARLGQRVVHRIRTKLFAHLSRLSFTFYDAASTGDLVTRATADVDTLSQFFGRSAVIIVTNLLFIIGILVVLLSWHPPLALVYLAMLPFIAAGMFVYARRVRPAMGRVRKQLSALTGRLETTLSGILVVKVFGRERFEAARFESTNRAYRDASVQTIRITALWMPIADVIMGLGTALVLLGGGYGVIQGDVTIGTLIAFTLYIGMLLRPIRQTGMMLSATMQALAAAERVFEIFDTTPEVRDRPDAVRLADPKGSIEFAGVSFAYDGKTQAVGDISFRVEAGETVALVGPSGAGKSTLVHLLARFYEPQSGRILIDGTDTRGVTIESLRAAIGIAMQNVFIFDATIGENIAYGNPSASSADVESVARMAQLHDFVSELPMHYDTPVGERGVELSGGQRQRLALARVLLRDPAVLLLDEPTSSQDTATERAMDAALEAARAGRTTIVIAHRLWTVHHADRIVVLDSGRVAELGVSTATESAHDSLMRAGGLYRSLYDLQFRSESHDVALGRSKEGGQ
ncbi:MAG: ABC transporter ATP-binding protein [Spirochaetaceae bacterium]|nr:MAG: ABC transporter ATP-binding protein [Spirochaetaceae bacterium]